MTPILKLPQEPLVGIALAAYKPDIEFFVVQLESIQNQNHSNWFCIIAFDSELSHVDNEPRLEKFRSDKRFRWVQNSKQLGSAKNFESTIQLCLDHNPDLIACSDQDDFWHPEKLEKKISAMRSLPPLSVLHCDMRILKKRENLEFEILDGTAWELEKRGVNHVTSNDLMVRNVIAGAGMLMDAELARRYPSFPADVFYHDHWFPLAASYFGKVHPLHEALYDYRIHGSNVAGLTEYHGFFHQSPDIKRLGIKGKAVKAFRDSAKRCDTAARAGLPVTFTTKILVQLRWDFGFSYLLKAALVVFNDPALARACVARAMGKVLSLF